jgi:hypothetical protein
MRSRFVQQAPLSVVLAGAAVLVLTAGPAHGQQRLLGRPRPECYPPAYPWPPAPCPAPAVPQPTPAKPEAEVPKPTEPTAPAPAEEPLSLAGGPAVRGETVGLATPNLQGDQLGIPAIAFGPRGFPPPPGQARAAPIVPSVRGFKISDNESPLPRDRVYLGFNYYDDVNQSVNRRVFSDLQNIRVYRETFGLEKTFLDGDASIGLRLPLNTLHADSLVPGLGGHETDVGDLSVFLKFALWRNVNTGSLFCTGLAVTAPTGPDSFAGFPDLSSPVHTTVIQPYAGYLWSRGNFYVHGFSALDVPARTGDVTLLYNDVGVGYFLHRDRTGTALLSAVVPTFEVHVNTPLNHRSAFNFTDPAATPDVVALTSGATFEFARRCTFAVGIVTPVTGPRPFNIEVLTQLNVRFGRSAATGSPARGNVLGY